MHREHGVHLDETGMEVAKQWDEHNALEIFRISREMTHVLDHSTDEDDPGKKKEPND
jgi:hypothetical protein